jgi:Na+-driven multidrug efflux pump
MFTTVLNVMFNYIFIKYFHLGVAGSALGTIAAITVSVICCLVYIFKKFPLLHPSKEDWTVDWKFYKEHLVIAIPMAIQFSIIAISGAITQSICNTFGPITIAGFVSAMRVEQVAMQPMISLGITMATYVAQNYGAGMIGRIRRGVFDSSVLSLISSIILALCMFLFGEHIINIFIEEEDHSIIDQVIGTATTYLNISILFYSFLGQIFIFRNALQGMGNAVIPLISSIVELAMRAFAAIYLAVIYGFVGMCFSSPIAWIGASIVVSWGYFHMVKRISRIYFRKKRIIVPYIAAE